MKVERIEVPRPECNHTSTLVTARVTVERDLSDLLPFLNATQEQARYYVKGKFLRFAYQGLVVVVEKDQVRICCFEEADQARAGAEAVIAHLAEIEAAKDRITPDSTPYHPPTVMEIFKLLPRISACGRCGHPSCMAFAAALCSGAAQPTACLDLAGDPTRAANYHKLKDLLG